MAIKSLWGVPVFEVDELSGMEDVKLTIKFEGNSAATARRIPYRTPTVEELKALSKRLRRLGSYRRRYARGAKK